MMSEGLHRKEAVYMCQKPNFLLFLILLYTRITTNNPLKTRGLFSLCFQLEGPHRGSHVY